MRQISWKKHYNFSKNKGREGKFMKELNAKNIIIVGLGITTMITWFFAIHSQRKIKKLKKKINEDEKYIVEFLNILDRDYPDDLEEE